MASPARSRVRQPRTVLAGSSLPPVVSIWPGRGREPWSPMPMCPLAGTGGPGAWLAVCSRAIGRAGAVPFLRWDPGEPSGTGSNLEEKLVHCARSQERTYAASFFAKCSGEGQGSGAGSSAPGGGRRWAAVAADLGSPRQGQLLPNPSPLATGLALFTGQTDQPQTGQTCLLAL